MDDDTSRHSPHVCTRPFSTPFRNKVGLRERHPVLLQEHGKLLPWIKFGPERRRLNSSLLSSVWSSLAIESLRPARQKTAVMRRILILNWGDYIISYNFIQYTVHLIVYLYNDNTAMVSYDFTYKYSDYFLNMALEIWAYWGTFQLSVVRTLVTARKRASNKNIPRQIHRKVKLDYTPELLI